MGPVGWEDDEREELASDFVDDHEAGIFSTGFAGRDGRGWDADRGDEEGGEGGGNREGRCSGGEDVGGGVPEENGGDRAVGAGAGREVACAEEGREEPGPAGFGALEFRALDAFSGSCDARLMGH